MKYLALAATCSIAAVDARADSGDRFDASTLAIQTGAGLGGAAVGGAVAGLAGAGLGMLASDGRTPLFGAALGGTIGGIVGSVVSVKLAGDARDATGGWGGTTLGMFGGLVVSSFVLYPMTMQSERPSIYTQTIILVAGTTLGAVLGYQASSDGAATDDRAFVLAIPASRF